MERKQEYIIQDIPEYIWQMYIEDLDGVEVAFHHVTFRKVSPSSIKKAIQAWTLFRAIVRGTFYALSNQDDIETHRRFVTLLGFKHFKDVECPDGVIRPCYISQDEIDG